MHIIVYIGMCVIGVFFILLGFQVYKPEQTERWVAVYSRWSWLFKWGGIGVLIWNSLMVATELNWI